MNSNCDLKICDFGLARGINEAKLAEDDLAVADAAAPEKPKDLLYVTQSLIERELDYISMKYHSMKHAPGDGARLEDRPSH